MRQLREICDANIDEMRKSLQNFELATRKMNANKLIEETPSAYGNRKQRRAARAIERKEHA